MTKNRKLASFGKLIINILRYCVDSHSNSSFALERATT
jgi:hypothetical protein